MPLFVLPIRTGGAAENMATDFLLLHRYPNEKEPRFRHYGWRQPAFTFGYSQKIAYVRSQLPPDGTFDVCRRPTGGGIVDHRADWTYALVIPRGHRLEELRASYSYRAIHEALAEALRSQGVPAATKSVCEAADDDCAATGVCFQRAEIYDVVHEITGAKIAGAAQKRNKHGLLFQGSIWRPALGLEQCPEGGFTPSAPASRAAFDWDAFHDAFVAELARALETGAQSVPWPELNEDEVSGLTEQYASPEWIDFR